MKAVIFACILGMVAAQNSQYVWDLLKAPLNVEEVQAILSSARAGDTYPNYNTIPDTRFECGNRNGFYADQETQCQVFHRCEINNGNHTRYLCTNTTIFNQITLTCDYFFNVDCAGFAKFENLVNSRLYTDLPAFDSPPENYVPIYLQNQAQTGSQSASNAVPAGQGAAQIVNAKPAKTQPKKGRNGRK